MSINQICNLFIKFSHFPKDCKAAKLKPLYKKGNKTDTKTFRPNFLLPIVSKIIEKVIHNQTMTYLTENNVLYRYHSNAFDNINHDILLKKMSALRFSDRSINWLH